MSDFGHEDWAIDHKDLDDYDDPREEEDDYGFEDEYDQDDSE